MKCPVKRGCMSLSTYILEYGRNVAQLRRRAYAPTSNTASHDNHQKSTHRFPFLSYMGMGLRYAAFRNAVASLLITKTGKCSTCPTTYQSFVLITHYFFHSDCRLIENGDCCHFPFEFGGNTYYGCTVDGWYREWCSLTNNYHDDKQWGHCEGRWNISKAAKNICIEEKVIIRLTFYHRLMLTGFRTILSCFH